MSILQSYSLHIPPFLSGKAITRLSLPCSNLIMDILAYLIVYYNTEKIRKNGKSFLAILHPADSFFCEFNQAFFIEVSHSTFECIFTHMGFALDRFWRSLVVKGEHPAEFINDF